MTEQKEEKLRKGSIPPDLLKERDALLQGLPRTGLVEEFFREFQEMRQRILELETENARLLAQLGAEDAIRTLMKTIANLEAEKQQLLSRVRGAEAASSDVSARAVQVEEEFSNLANLFVASNQLHSTLSPDRVCRRIREVLAQLVGAERFALYYLDPIDNLLVPIASEGLSASELEKLPISDPRVNRAIVYGESMVDDSRESSTNQTNEPVVVIPLSFEERQIGIIAIYSTLEQKPQFRSLDFELFHLLKQHAATALVSSGLFAGSDRNLPSIDAFTDLIV